MPRRARDLQHGSGQPVHSDRLHQGLGEPGDQDQHGWQRGVARRWKTIKYEEVYLQACASVSEARAGIGRYLGFYSSRRPHSSLDGKTPGQAYFNQPMPEAAKA